MARWKGRKFCHAYKEPLLPSANTNLSKPFSRYQSLSYCSRTPSSESWTPQTHLPMKLCAQPPPPSREHNSNQENSPRPVHWQLLVCCWWPWYWTKFKLPLLKTHMFLGPVAVHRSVSMGAKAGDMLHQSARTAIACARSKIAPVTKWPLARIISEVTFNSFDKPSFFTPSSNLSQPQPPPCTSPFCLVLGIPQPYLTSQSTVSAPDFWSMLLPAHFK